MHGRDPVCICKYIYGPFRTLPLLCMLPSCNSSYNNYLCPPLYVNSSIFRFLYSYLSLPLSFFSSISCSLYLSLPLYVAPSICRFLYMLIPLSFAYSICCSLYIFCFSICCSLYLLLPLYVVPSIFRYSICCSLYLFFRLAAIE